MVWRILLSSSIVTSDEGDQQGLIAFPFGLGQTPLSEKTGASLRAAFVAAPHRDIVEA